MAVTCPKCHFDNPETLKFCGECGTPLPSSKDIRPEVTETFQMPIKELTTGSTFAGRYQIIEELGKGGMGKVYRVLDKKLKEEVALKLIKPEIASDKETIERFSNELKLARKIGHRNVGKVYELMEDGETHFITMEYVAGEDLKSFILRSRQLTIGTAVAIAKQVCEGLAEAHRLGVVHRDLKPGNIMIDKEGNARIMDFGIARLIEAKGITGQGIIIGTPVYMSPEQVEGKGVDQRADIYSLGVILYEMVTGRVPFEGETALSIALMHKTEAPPDPRIINPQLPVDLSRVILRCLEKEKEQRYQNAVELLSELNRIEERISTRERILPTRKGVTHKEILSAYNLKKLLVPVLVIIAVIALGVIILQHLSKKEPVPTQATKRSMAVLPFVDLSPGKDYEYLSDGITETLIDALANIENLRILARTSSFFFKGKEQDIQDIGKKLNVETLLEGSVQVVGDRLRITVQLINVKDSYHLWSNRYDRKLEDVFVIQDDIAQMVVNTLKIRLLGEREKPLVKNYTANREAYDLYLRGRYYWNLRTGEGFKRAIEYFEQAIKLDPIYALAYAGMADCYGMLSRYAILAPEEGYPKALMWAKKALDLDKNLAEAHTSIGFVKLFYDWDWSGAEEEFKQAIRLNESYPTARHWYSHYFMAMGQAEESLRESKLALEFDPLDLALNTHLGYHYYYARQYNQAIDQLRRTLELDPNFARANYYLGLTYMQLGRNEESIIEFQKAINRSKGQSSYKASLGQAYARGSNQAESFAILDELKILLSEKTYVSPFEIAIMYLSLGEKDQAFEWLSRACLEKDAGIHLLRVEPRLDGIRSDPRFRELLKKVRLEK